MERHLIIVGHKIEVFDNENDANSYKQVLISDGVEPDSIEHVINTPSERAEKVRAECIKLINQQKLEIAKLKSEIAECAYHNKKRDHRSSYIIILFHPSGGVSIRAYAVESDLEAVEKFLDRGELNPLYFMKDSLSNRGYHTGTASNPDDKLLSKLITLKQSNKHLDTYSVNDDNREFIREHRDDFARLMLCHRLQGITVSYLPIKN